MVSRAYHLKDSESFTQKALQWASQFESACYLDSNGYRDNYGNINVFIAVGASDSVVGTAADSFARIQQFIDRYPNTWIPGYFSYDLKNEIEELESQHPNRTGFPDAYFFISSATLLIGKYNVEVKSERPDEVIKAIEATQWTEQHLEFQGRLRHRMSRAEYVDAFQRLQAHI